MKLTTLSIENFRGIKGLTIDFDDITVLIGENNSGKTAILDALRIALRDLRSKRGLAFDQLDFHLKDATTDPSMADPIKLTLTFVESQSNTWSREAITALNRSKVLQVHKDGRKQVSLVVTAGYNSVAKDFEQDWQFLDLDGNALAGLAGNPLMTLQEQVAYSYLSALRDAARHFDAKGQYWRPFLKSSTLTSEQKSDIEELLEKVNGTIVAAHTSFAIVRDKLKLLHDVVPLSSGDVVSIDAVPARIFDMLAKTQISLGTSTGSKLPVDRHGEGTQSLAVLMLFSAFLAAWGKGSPIIALEEPEAHLHPSAVRALWKLIEELPGQKIISTHSGDLLSEIPIASLRRLHRTGAGVKLHRIPPGTFDAKQTRQFDFHVRATRGGLLFSRCWILVEGESELVAIPELARHLNIDLDRNGISCIQHRHAGISTFLTAANVLGIPWCVVSDNDSQGQAILAIARSHLAGAAEAAHLFVMQEDDLEQHLCTAGFGAVFETYLTAPMRAKLTVPAGDPSYWKQVTKAINVRGHSKPEAILRVMDELRKGVGTAPPVLVAGIKQALVLSEAG